MFDIYCKLIRKAASCNIFKMYRSAWSGWLLVSVVGMVSVVNVVGLVSEVDLECLNFVDPTVFVSLI